MAALHDGENFIIENYSIGLMPSLSLTDTKYVDIKDLQVIAMGADTFKDEDPLPAVPLELELISSQIWSGKSVLNQGFTKDNLSKTIDTKSFGILHLATHGEFRKGKIDQSYIQLADTKLRLNQIDELGLNKPPIELLVLSACRTALGDEEAELGFAGLAHQAGVKTALGSLWYVSDAGTLGLMSNFYQQLGQVPIKAEALRQAQLAMLRGEVKLADGNLVSGDRTFPLSSELESLGNINLSHPFYWSAFTMIGNPW